jgi:TRAP-type C4-dicarboxylate transport system substrate-binding protein
VIKLKYADQNPSNGWEGEHAAQPWLKQIQDATNGRVQIDSYFNQTLAKGTDDWVATQSGIADLAWMFHGYWANMTPLADVITLPSLPIKTAEKGSEVIWNSTKSTQPFKIISRMFTF